MVTEGTIVSLSTTINYLSYNKSKEINKIMEEISRANINLIMAGLIFDGCDDEIDTVYYYISVPETSYITNKIFKYSNTKYDLSNPEEIIRLYKRIVVDFRFYNNDLHLRDNKDQVYANLYDSIIVRENIRKCIWTDENYNEVDKYVSDTIDKIHRYINISKYKKREKKY